MRKEAETREGEKENQGVLLVMAGPTGGGKDTIMSGLLEADPDMEKLVTLASRSPRAGEIRGWDYHFVGTRAFLKLMEEGEFLEAINYGKNEENPDYKGTLKRSILKINEGKTVVWRIDMGAAANVHEILQSKLSEEEYEAIADRVVVVLVGVRSLQELRTRMVKREGFGYDREKFLDRMRADWEVWQNNSFEHIVYNEAAQVEEAVAEIRELIYAKKEKQTEG